MRGVLGWTLCTLGLFLCVWWLLSGLCISANVGIVFEKERKLERRLKWK